MSVRVGIPRGMYFYKFYPFAKRFLMELGAEVVPSPPTNKEILNLGSRFCIDDACLPVKVYHGHAEYLKDKVDYMLIPRLTSIVPREYICPKFGGLPEMVKYSINGLPKLIDVEINMYKSRISLINSLYELGTVFTKNPYKIKKAADKAAREQIIYDNCLLKGELPCKYIDGTDVSKNNSGPLVGIATHPYLLYDSFINMNLLDKLSDRGIKFILPEMLEKKTIEEKCRIFEKRMFWSSSKDLIGSALYMFENNNIDGILMLTSFGCGIDSLSIELIQRLGRKKYNKPFMVMTLDEHTGDANFNTRLEAFFDLIDRRQAN
ncbi:acyl-CoA dehydratase activase-related protein [Lutispora thermophila]|uniref:Predicted nucleotide-binding protein, sugar kinase/HSP70/actin superfamily n=1 Tax=Lutispora thermophila DSM 19022 TaxID=1122184 RepID=A0A1M6B378_9FIRM|nr:acyl-CoA dehydratase activase-related protein [Lutispora thermophila]SHI43202.1 Predicted nucleotide-binding protein, sugar kinase/HSP70/actin superfamily [Lutispora thermophila DSM 19022]